MHNHMEAKIKHKPVSCQVVSAKRVARHTRPITTVTDWIRRLTLTLARSTASPSAIGTSITDVAAAERTRHSVGRVIAAQSARLSLGPDAAALKESLGIATALLVVTNASTTKCGTLTAWNSSTTQRASTIEPRCGRKCRECSRKEVWKLRKVERRPSRARLKKPLLLQLVHAGHVATCRQREGASLPAHDSIDVVGPLPLRTAGGERRRLCGLPTAISRHEPCRAIIRTTLVANALCVSSEILNERIEAAERLATSHTQTRLMLPPLAAVHVCRIRGPPRRRAAAEHQEAQAVSERPSRSIVQALRTGAFATEAFDGHVVGRVQNLNLPLLHDGGRVVLVPVHLAAGIPNGEEHAPRAGAIRRRVLNTEVAPAETTRHEV
mmetsp:Transcript_137184/g.438696  ORF Transcript_137184/g.438696 Transcript_137184/m.438696 type:complete len:381 (-) Transcript_137184:190-1332(-)